MVYPVLVRRLREGELFALQYKDIDFDKLSISVSKSLDKHTRELSSLKTDKSNRIITFPNSLVKLLKKYIAHEKAKHLKKGFTELLTKDQYIFTSTTCTPLVARNFLRKWERLCKQLKIDYIPFKALRATYGTMLCEANVPIKTAATLMGHSSTTTTEKYYVATREKHQREEVDKLNRFLM